MEDLSISSLRESKNEWSARLVNILTPHIIDGFRSIFEESWKLCKENGEQAKYLMTFQNLISRIPKWNNAIIEKEQTRIIEKSGCGYLEDLITCVHVIQLKVLSNMRVSSKSKKVDINIPKVDDFIHKVYILCARKFYEYVYLFERGIPALVIQKNNREIEVVVQECILNAVRQNMPIEHLIKSYMDETNQVEEEITVEEIHVDPPAAVEEKKIDAAVSSEPSHDGGTAGSTGGIKFDDNDKAIYTNNVEEIINAPKTIDRLEEIATQRHFQRKLEEEDDDEDSLVIGDDIKLGDAFFEDLDTPTLDFETLP